MGNPAPPMSDEAQLASPTRAERIAVLGFFGLLLALGLAVFSDYGFPWDEINNHNVGRETWDYVFEGARDFRSFEHDLATHGAAFQLVLILVERVLGLQDWRQVIFARHLVTFGVFCLGAVFFYLLCRRHFGSWPLALGGVALLVLTPRIFAHAFYNSVDIPLMALFIVSIYTLVLFDEEPSPRRAVLHGVACAWLVGVRSLGVAVPGLTLLAVGLRLLTAERKRDATFRAAAGLGVFGVTLAAGVYVLWPYLWEDPVRRLYSSLLFHAELRWPHPVLYLGEMMDSSAVPWHYTPVWMAITLPNLHLLGFAAGVVALPRRLFEHGLLSAYGRLSIIFLCWLGGPLLAPIVMRPALFDGWRHHFFVYPAFLIVVLTGLQAAFRGVGALGRGRWATPLRAALAVAVVAGGCEAAAFMLRNHPHQQVYFNRWAGDDLRRNFELDYWGLSYRQALEHIVADDQAETIQVAVANDPGLLNALLLPQADRGRLSITSDLREADYFVGNFRWHRGDYGLGPEVFSISVEGTRIMVVEKLR